MKLPISYEQFKKSPITAIAFLLVIVVGYLYLDADKKTEKFFNDYEKRIEKLEMEEKELEARLDKINNRLLECLGLNQ